jgi:DNA-binding transcriptional regulator YhcF (GntR family)
MIAKNTTRQGGPVTFERQRQVVEAIARHVGARGYSPTMRELAAEVGISLARVAQLLPPLVEAGVVTCRPHLCRTLAVNREAAAKFFAR